MGDERKLKGTAALVALAIVSGCATKDAHTVSRDDHLKPFYSTKSIAVCDGQIAECSPIELIVLKQPENVIYTTRAGIAITDPSNDAAQLNELPQAPAGGTDLPQNDAERSE